MIMQTDKNILKHLIAQCSPNAQRTFKLAFGRNNGKRSMDDALKLDINECVDLMEENQIGLAIELCNRTLKKSIQLPQIDISEN